MALNIPTTEEIKDRNVSNLESNLNQTSPLNDKAFNRVIGGMEALNHTELYKFGVERAKQNLALTATGDDLERIGLEFDTIRKPAESAVLTVTVPGVNGTILPVTLNYIGELNGLRYFPDAAAEISGGVATFNITAENVGVDGNLNISDTLTLDSQIPGAENTATVTVIVNTGADKEDQEIYRERVLFAERATCGGGNATDYKIWAEEVAGVTRAYPYAGKPFDVIGTSFPGDRTVYIQADESIDPDGIAPTSLLDEVRDALNTDPVTGKSRPPLGLIDDTLFIESIIRTSFFVEIRQLDVSLDIETQVKADIETALEQYFLSLRPFVEGVDIPSDRNDQITTPSVNEIVQEILAINGASAQEVAFGLALGSFIPLKTLDPNELAKLDPTNGVTYVS